MLFSQRTQWPTEANALSQQTALLKQDKISILDLTASNPSQCGFSSLNEGLFKSFLNPKNLNYEPDAHGMTQAREVICQYYAQKGRQIHPSQVFLTASTSEAYSFVFRLLMEPKDLLLAPQPSYPLLDYLTALNDVTVRRYGLKPENKWAVDLTGFYERQLQDPKAVLVINPNNPTGNFLHHTELAELNIFCKNRNVALLADEVFLDYYLGDASPAPDQMPVTVAGNRHSLTFAFSGISKILGLPQMKLSWIVVSGPEQMVEDSIKRLEVISDTYLSVSTPVQNALPEWFKIQKTVQHEILERLKKNYQYLQQKFGRGGAIRTFTVEGGWHAMLQLPSEHTDEEWACLLLKKDHVLTHPGYLFDFAEGSFIVLSLLAATNVFQEGVEKIAKRVTA